MPDSTPLTAGVDHVGLSVGDLGRSRAFFIDCLGWSLVGERADYPAAFVSDGTTRLTLWQVAEPGAAIAFDRRRNIGLHHLALRVKSREQLQALHARVASWDGVVIEFAPEPSAGGPRWHSMIREPGGCRLEFVWDPR
jgi:catechol 2,3-dioxygenase-like lactoylglutathione lyase family enzyme